MSNMQNAVRVLSERIAAARADGTPLCLRGGGSKDFLGRSPGELLDTRGLSGVISYEPTELVVTVGCGTPLAELEALLAEQGQCLAFEPPHFTWSRPHATQAPSATVGGMLAAGLSGPARASVGSVRDYVLGMKLINGLGQELTFGGQVMKNVAGYDVSRLMVGARGTLGLLTEVSLKVLPLAPAEATLCFGLEQAEALERLHQWGGQPLPLNASCWVRDDSGTTAKPSLYVRLRGATAAVEAASRKMLMDAPGQRLDNAQTAPDWTLCRDQALPFFTHPATGDAVLWRLSLPQTAAALALAYPTLIEWHGAQRWLWAPLAAAPEVHAAARQAGGSAAVFWSGQASPAGTPQALTPTQAALAAISQRLKTSFDPAGIFNPGLAPHANPSLA